MTKDASLYLGPEHEPNKYRLVRQVWAQDDTALWEAELDVAGEWEPVAVKVWRAERSEDLVAATDRWAEQAETLRFVRHPGVVGVREHFAAGAMHHADEVPAAVDRLCLVMNWVAGSNLAEWASANALAREQYELVTHLAQVADVLDWLHSGGAAPSGRTIVHGDVRAENVIITPAGQAVLVAFGRGDAASSVTVVDDRRAFGAVAYGVLTGAALPADTASIRRGLLHVPLVAAQPESVDALMAMYASEPSMRPACGQWVRLLRVGGETLMEAPTQPLAAPPTSSRRGVGAKVAAAVLAAAAIAGGVAVGLSRWDGSPAAAADTTTPDTTTTTTTPDTTTPDTTTPDTTTPDTTTPDTTTATTPQTPRMPACFPNCQGKDFTDGDLAGLDLSGGDFRGAKLVRTSLVGANLERADLSGADLRTADLSDVHAANAIFANANMIGVIGKGGDFNHAYLYAYSMTGALMQDANLEGANLGKEYLLSVQFDRANLRGANLKAAYLQNTVFTDADLSGADVSGTDTFGTGDITGVILTGTTMPDGTVHP